MITYYNAKDSIIKDKKTQDKEKTNILKIKKMKGLRRCPHCRKWDTMSIISIKQNGFKITCDYAKGGCGASGGMGKTKEEAVSMWNMRIPMDHLRHEITAHKYSDKYTHTDLVSSEILELVDEEEEKYANISI